MKLKLKIKKVVDETPDVKSIHLDLNKTKFEFKPGQFISLILDVEDPKGNRRAFSIASSPTEKELIITSKITDTPYKKKFASLKKGEEVLIDGPYGKLELQNNYSQKAVMLAGGIGITPLRCFIKYATDKKLPLQIVLLYSNKIPEDIAFKDDLEKLAKQNKNFTLADTITRPEESKTKWKGRVGRIDENLIKEYVKDLDKAFYYVIGPPPMVEAMLQILKNLKIKEDKIKIERFFGY